jgi:hypothetical protein
MNNVNESGVDQMRWVVVLLGVVWLMGCSKVNEAHYARLKSGMTIEEVEAVLGNADICDEALGFRQCRWGDDSAYIKVKFLGKKVIALSKKGLN